MTVGSLDGFADPPGFLLAGGYKAAFLRSYDEALGAIAFARRMQATCGPLHKAQQDDSLSIGETADTTGEVGIEGAFLGGEGKWLQGHSLVVGPPTRKRHGRLG